MDNDGAFTVNSGGELNNWSGTLNNDGTLENDGALYLGASSCLNNSGTVTDGGELEAQSPSALPDFGAPGELSVTSGGTLAVTVGGSGDWNSSTTDDIAALLGSGVFHSGAWLGIDTTDGDFSYSHIIADTAAGPLGVVVFGGNTLTLSGDNTYTGGTDLQAGTVIAGASSALGSGALTVNGGAVDLNGYTVTVSSLSGTGGLVTNNNSWYTSTLIVSQGADTTNYLYSGDIQDGSSNVGLDVSGSGTLTLGGTSSISGGVMVGAGGTLAIDEYGTLNNFGTLVNRGTLVNNGTLLVNNGSEFDNYSHAALDNEGMLTIDDSSELDNHRYAALDNEGTLTIDNGSAFGNEQHAAMSNQGTLALDNGSYSVERVLCHAGQLRHVDHRQRERAGHLPLRHARRRGFPFRRGRKRAVALEHRPVDRQRHERRPRDRRQRLVRQPRQGGKSRHVHRRQRRKRDQLVRHLEQRRHAGERRQPVPRCVELSEQLRYGDRRRRAGAASALRIARFRRPGAFSVTSGGTLAVMAGGSGEWNSSTTDDIAALLGSGVFRSGAWLGIDTTDGDFCYAHTIADPAVGTATASLGVVVLGGNTLTLSGDNTFTGGTTVTGGTLAVSSDSALGSGALTLDGGTLSSSGSDPLTLSRTVTLGASGGTIDTSQGDITLDGDLLGDGGLQKAGGGTFTIAAGHNVNNGGDIVVDCGTLGLDSPAAGQVLVNGGQIDPASDFAPTWWDVTIQGSPYQANPNAPALSTDPGSRIVTREARVFASDARSAVREAAAGMVAFANPAYSQRYFSIATSRGTGADGPFDVGTAQQLHKAHPGFNTGNLPPDTGENDLFIALDDPATPGNYDDYLWTATALPSSTPGVSGGTDFGPAPSVPSCGCCQTGATGGPTDPASSDGPEGPVGDDGQVQYTADDLDEAGCCGSLGDNRSYDNTFGAERQRLRLRLAGQPKAIARPDRRRADRQFQPQQRPLVRRLGRQHLLRPLRHPGHADPRRREQRLHPYPARRHPIPVRRLRADGGPQGRAAATGGAGRPDGPGGLRL